MLNIQTVGQRNLKFLGGQGKTGDEEARRRPDVQTDKLIPVYPPYNFVVQGYYNFISVHFNF
jgi:hypothetical protein